MNQNDSNQFDQQLLDSSSNNDQQQIEINLNYNFVSYEDSNDNKCDDQCKSKVLVDQDQNDDDVITFRYEHYRSQTFASLVRCNSNDSVEYSSQSQSSSIYSESDDDHHRKFPRQIFEEDFIADKLPSTAFVNNDKEQQQSSAKSGKLRQFSKCLSSTTNDLHSLFRKFSCLKRISSLVDLNSKKTAETLLKKKQPQQRLTYQNGKTLTKSDIIHCKEFEEKSNIEQEQSFRENSHQQQSSSTFIVPKLYIEEIADGDNTQIEQFNDPVKIIEKNISKINFNSQQTTTTNPDYNNFVDQSNLIIYSESELSNDSNNNTQIVQSISLSNLYPIPDQSSDFHSESDYSTEDVHKSNELTEKMIANQQNFESTQNSTPTNQPSYVNISRVNHGYVPYNRYTSEYRRDDSLLRSPIEDRFTSLPIESTTNKGFLQQKVESLYGETFAEDWNKNRVKKGQSIEKSIQPNPIDQSPANQIKTTLASSKLFQKINCVDHTDSSEDTTNKSFDKDWWLREHQPQSNRNPIDDGQNDGRIFMEKIQEQKSRIQNKIQQDES
ncbi:uncharacterized protein LOC113789112 isoform X2 [Dermatophagoides pteronyssinus]|uniref:uncharacterized protein LOC113789112 isoform X2 n=1 Tax=Dermatophagoides pteronyssinus TaxID=6956 RepID=UPI003F677F56